MSSRVDRSPVPFFCFDYHFHFTFTSLSASLSDYFISDRFFGSVMPKGLTQNSPLFSLGAFLAESAANTFTQLEIALPLNTLDREVFVITDVCVESSNPNLVALDTRSTAYVSKTQIPAATDPGINDTSIIGLRRTQIEYDAGTGNSVAFEFNSPMNLMGSTGTSTDYIAVVATPNWFLSIQGVNNTAAMWAAARIWGYRAKCTADLYAALVTEELSG